MLFANNDDDADHSVGVIRYENVQGFVNELCLVYAER